MKFRLRHSNVVHTLPLELNANRPAAYSTHGYRPHFIGGMQHVPVAELDVLKQLYLHNCSTAN